MKIQWKKLIACILIPLAVGGLAALSTRGSMEMYGVQLAFNYLWPIFFFTLGAYLFSFIWLVLLWLLILATAILFYRINKTAGWLMLPYLLWVAFAGYLNLSVYILN